MGEGGYWVDGFKNIIIFNCYYFIKGKFYIYLNRGLRYIKIELFSLVKGV